MLLSTIVPTARSTTKLPTICSIRVPPIFLFNWQPLLLSWSSASSPCWRCLVRRPHCCSLLWSDLRNCGQSTLWQLFKLQTQAIRRKMAGRQTSKRATLSGIAECRSHDRRCTPVQRTLARQYFPRQSRTSSSEQHHHRTGTTFAIGDRKRWPRDVFSSGTLNQIHLNGD